MVFFYNHVVYIVMYRIVFVISGRMVFSSVLSNVEGNELGLYRGCLVLEWV